jgi:hypothetical protein
VDLRGLRLAGRAGGRPGCHRRAQGLQGAERVLDPGASAMRSPSASAWPFAYVSIIVERQPDRPAERRPEARAIHTIAPMTMSAPSTIHSHSSDEPDPLAGAVEPACAGSVGGACDGSLLAAGCVTGALLVGVNVTLRLGDKLEIAFLIAPLCPHPAASDPRATTTAATASPLLSRCITGPPSSGPNRAPR